MGHNPLNILRGEIYLSIKLLASTHLLSVDPNILNFCEHKVWRVLEYCFRNNSFWKFSFLQKFSLEISKVHSLQNVLHG